MKLVLLLAILLPGPILGIGLSQLFKWKVEQPNRYLYVNGQPISLDLTGNPLPEVAALPESSSSDSGSVLDNLNPFNAFANIWNLLPSFNPFSSSSDLNTGLASTNDLPSGLPPGMLMNGDSDTVGLEQLAGLMPLSGEGGGSILSGLLRSFGWPSFLGGGSEDSGVEGLGSMGSFGSPDGLGSMGGFGSTDGLGSIASLGIGAIEGLKNLAGLGSMGGLESMGGLGSMGSQFMKRADNTYMNTPVRYLYGHGVGSDESSEAGLIKRADKEKDKGKDKGPVKYFYVPHGGQGGFLRYEIPLTPKPANKPKQDEVKSMPKPKRNVPAPYPYSRPMPPIKASYDKLQLTKPYYHQDEEIKTKEKPDDAPAPSDDSAMEDPFPCPTFGQWTYDGVMCTALVPFPRWACKPIDLVLSGRLVICRNKVYF